MSPVDPNGDPNGPANAEGGLYGVEVPPDEALVHVVPVRFEATTSYRKGTARGPAAVLRASRQVDLLDLDLGRPYEAGIAMLEEDARVADLNEEASRLAAPVQAAHGEVEGRPELARALERVNAIGSEINDLVGAATARALDAGKLPVVLGGDHAVPFGAWREAAARHPGLGLLHFDAHADLRRAYEGFVWSHASVVGNALEQLDGVARIVQVGIRDLCDEELERIGAAEGRVRTLFDRDWARARLAGGDLTALAREHLAHLPDEVWVTFDVDGLDPTLCPSTGTPVPGGLDWHEAGLWLTELARSGRTVVGADLVEVAPGRERPMGEGWDEIVGARLLYRLIGAAVATRRR
jgi:agmatinase